MEIRFSYILIAIVLLAVAVSFPSLFETVDRGSYHVKQALGSGEMTAYMRPGMYFQGFGAVSVFPVSETFYFTKDSEGGINEKDKKIDASVEVRFNDGSVCHISGTCRVDLPKSEKEAIELITVHGFKTYDDLEYKLILPIVRKALIMSANFMTAKESYSDKRSDFFRLAWDQIENGLYVTKDVQVKDADPITGQMVNRVVKEIMVDERGVAKREKNPIEGLGIHLSNFEVKAFEYEDRVQAQIKTQQEAIMSVQTAKANALRAQQDSITAEETGKANVMKAKYEKEQEKIQAEVRAQQEASVATINAEKLVTVATKTKEQALVLAEQVKEVAALELDAAKLQKQREIEIGTGEAERKRLVLGADGALTQKLEAYVAVQKVYADAIAQKRVPNIWMAGGGSGTGGTADSEAQALMQMLMVKTAKDLSLDMTITTPEKK